MATELDNFEPVAKIVVIGVGGAGNNAVNRMISERIDNVDFWVFNTDKQALSTSKADNRLVLGEEITHGLGAGGKPSVGKEAAEHSREQIENIVKDADLVFIAAGMGGGTGTGAAPVVADIAKKAGALTVAIVTRPFSFEGKTRMAHSVSGLNELKDNVDSIIVVSNDKLLIVNGNAKISDAFSESDRVLAQSVKTVVDLILMPAVINLDYADVKATLENSGIALIGFGMGSGKDKAKIAAQEAISSPLLEASLRGARKAIVSITCGQDVSLFEAQSTVQYIIETSGSNLDIKLGVAFNDLLEDQLLVSVIASDFENDEDFTAPESPSSDGISIFGPSVNQNVNNNDKDDEDNSDDDDFDSFKPDFLKTIE